jgi:imidazolonepropionase-like amidohydrolase
LIRSGGVTTSLVLPGSGNVQGGQAAYVKLRNVGTVGGKRFIKGDCIEVLEINGNTVVSRYSIDIDLQYFCRDIGCASCSFGLQFVEMLLANAPRALKMACGENPKRVYGSMSQTPDSRLGIGWLQRKQWYAAAQLKAQQDQWECANATGQVSEPYPEDIALEPLVAVLRNQARLMVHCYKVEDFEMMLRTANEFGFKIATFQHALEAWKIPDIMAANNVTIATFADSWGFKMEGFDASVKAPWILKQNGVNIALKSDHPVVFAKYLMFEAGKAHHYGLDAESALQAVTIVSI